MSDISRLSRRLIPCLDVRDGRLTKGIKFGLLIQFRLQEHRFVDIVIFEVFAKCQRLCAIRSLFTIYFWQMNNISLSMNASVLIVRLKRPYLSLIVV